MLKDETRCCDVCGADIPIGQHYVLSKIPKEKSDLVEEVMAEFEPDPGPTIQIDSDGNFRLDLCLDCYMKIGDPDSKMIN